MGHRIKWAPKLQPDILKKFYEMKKSGVVDEGDGLVDEIGQKLYLRCESIMMATQGEFWCPGCGEKITVDKTVDTNQKAACQNCGFAFNAAEFHESYRHRELWQDSAHVHFGKYRDEYPRCKTADEKIIMIDALIHSFYYEIETGAINRANGNHLIEGSLDHVVKLLHELSGIQPENDAVFAKTAELMWRRRGRRTV